MNMKLLLLLMLSLFSLNCQALPFAPTTETTLYTFQQLGWNSSITLNGYSPTYTFYLPIGRQANPEKATLHLKMAFSAFLSQATSVGIKFNQTTLRRLSIPTNLETETTWDIELPLAELTKDWQALTFSAYLSSEKNLCDPNIWIYISPNSSITLTTTKLPFKGALNQLPYPFINPVSITPVPVTLLFPTPFEEEDVNSLGQIAWRLGQQLEDAKVNLSVNFINDMGDHPKDSHLILVGSADKLRQNGFQLSVLGHAEELQAGLKTDAGILSLIPSPASAVYALLTLTGRNNLALKKALSAFLNQDFKSLSSGQLAIVEKIETKTTELVSGEDYHTTFKAIGYSDQSVSGLGRHKLAYNMPLPNDRVPNFAQIKTFMTIPLLPQNTRSQMTVLVNGLKQSSFWPTKEHSAFKTEVNSEALKPGINKIEYYIDLHSEHERCTPENFDELWATIYAQSEFQVVFFDQFPLAMLNQLPVPFESELTVVLPQKLSKTVLNSLANLFLTLGHVFQARPIEVNFRTDNEVNEEFIRTNNVILIGTPSTNPWLKFALEYLPLQLGRQSRLLKLPQEQLAVSASNGTGLLELMPSPWREGKAILLITGNGERELAWSIDALVSDSRRSSLNGNIAVINADKSIELFNSYDNRYIGLKRRVTMYLSNLGGNLWYYLKNHPQILIYLLVLVVPFIVLLRNRNK